MGRELKYSAINNLETEILRKDSFDENSLFCSSRNRVTYYNLHYFNNYL
jgi:hypothetical protein